MQDRNLNTARNYEKIYCSECEGTEELQKHRYKDTITCVYCLNMKANELESENINDLVSEREE